MKPNSDGQQDDKRKKIGKREAKKDNQVATLYGGYRASVIYTAYVNQLKAEIRLGNLPVDTHILDFYQFKKSSDNLVPDKWGLSIKTNMR